MKYNKLVRDKIPEYVTNKGGNPIYHIANEEEYWEKLKEKLLEEFEEFKVDENIEEFADLLEVLEAVAEYRGFSQKEIEETKNQKAKEKGKFKDRIILDES